jgi:hypothetical protein
VTAHPGAYCSPAGAIGQTNAGTEMVCSVGKPGDRARWRRNGPKPATTPRKRRARASKAASAPLPQVDAGIDPNTQPKHAVPEAADAQVKPDTEPMTDQEAADKIRQAYGEQPDKWMTMKDLAAKTGLTPEEIKRGTRHLLRNDENFRADQEPFGHRVQDDDRAVSPVIGGEALHKFTWIDVDKPIEPIGQDAQTGPSVSPAPIAEPVTPAARPAEKATVMPPRSPDPIEPPNGGWGIDQGLMHFDSALGKAWTGLSDDDKRLTVDGRPLANVVKDLGEGITRRRHSSQQALDELRRIRNQLPDGSRPAAVIDQAITRLDAPVKPMPNLPADTPAPMRQLVQELNSIPLVRRGYDHGMPMGDEFHEDDRVADIARRWSAGELSATGVGREIENLTRYRHESMEGWTEIREAVARATRDVRVWGRRKQA